MKEGKLSGNSLQWKNFVYLLRSDSYLGIRIGVRRRVGGWNRRWGGTGGGSWRRLVLRSVGSRYHINLRKTKGFSGGKLIFRGNFPVIFRGIKKFSSLFPTLSRRRRRKIRKRTFHCQGKRNWKIFSKFLIKNLFFFIHKQQRVLSKPQASLININK